MKNQQKRESLLTGRVSEVILHYGSVGKVRLCALEESAKGESALWKNQRCKNHLHWKNEIIETAHWRIREVRLCALGYTVLQCVQWEQSHAVSLPTLSKSVE